MIESDSVCRLRRAPSLPARYGTWYIERAAATSARIILSVDSDSGTRLGPYEIISALGAGGMGEVWKARDTRVDRIVAIKRLKAEHTERFKREARAIAALNHPHICQLYDVGPDYW